MATSGTVTVDFPGSLPCVSRIDGFSMVSSAAALRTPPEAAAAVQRRTHNIMPTQIQIAWRVGNTDLDPLITWLNEFGFDWFNVDLAGIESSDQGLFKVPIAVRLMSSLTVSLIRIHRQNWWIVSGSAEYQASVDVLNLPDIGTPSTNVSLIVADGHHAQTADSVTLAAPSSGLMIQEARHTHTADNLSLGQSSQPLTIQDATHAHTADQLLLTSSTLLTIQDATHAHAADNITLSVGIPLIIQEAAHASSSDNVTLSL